MTTKAWDKLIGRDSVQHEPRFWGNPYTHEEHSRQAWTNPTKDCDWCGQYRRTLYKYDGRKGWFCNKECEGSYNS